MRMTKEELEKAVDNICAKTPCSHVYVIMRCGYTEKEMLEKPYSIDLLLYDGCYPSADMIWETDWWEGEEYIDVWNIFDDDELLNLLMRGDINDIR